MQRNLRSAFAIGQTKITGLKMTGTNSALVEYDELAPDGSVANSGVAACFDVDKVELDEENLLVGDSRISANGQFIVQKRTFDRSGLGRK